MFKSWTEESQPQPLQCQWVRRCRGRSTMCRVEAILKTDRNYYKNVNHMTANAVLVYLHRL